jgi:hypothetical protein
MLYLANHVLAAILLWYASVKIVATPFQHIGNQLLLL